MPNLARQSFNVSIFVATVVITAQNIALQYVDVVKAFVSARWLALLLSAGLTSVAYRLVIEFYKRRAWRWFNKQFVLAGKWEHSLVPADPEPNNDQHGEFEVLQTAFETKIVGGKNFDQTTGRISHWKSLAVFDEELAEQGLWVIYQIERGEGKLVSGEGEIDRGLIRVHLEKDSETGRVTTMSGTYWDAGRSQHKGSFEARLADKKAPRLSTSIATVSS
jgi:hypothetical protein